MTGKDLVKKWLKEEMGTEEEGNIEQTYRFGEIEEVLAELDLEEILDVLTKKSKYTCQISPLQ